MENAIALDPADPYLYLTAAEEVYERQQRWDDIIHVFRLLPEIDPSREFALVAPVAAPEHAGDDSGQRRHQPRRSTRSTT